MLTLMTVSVGQIIAIGQDHNTFTKPVIVLFSTPVMPHYNVPEEGEGEGGLSRSSMHIIQHIPCTFIH